MKVLLHQETEHLKAASAFTGINKSRSITTNQECYHTMEKKPTNLFSKWRNIWTNCYPQLSEKLGTKFQLKAKTKFHQQNNFVFYSKCPDETCNED